MTVADALRATLQDHHVPQAKDKMTAQMLPITVKKARVSLRVKRTPFQPLPDGHPAVPFVYAVGRFEHVEYLSMELFGPSMSDTTCGSPEEDRSSCNCADGACSLTVSHQS
jgi:hypothetical protein